LFQCSRALNNSGNVSKAFVAYLLLNYLYNYKTHRKYLLGLKYVMRFPVHGLEIFIALTNDVGIKLQMHATSRTGLHAKCALFLSDCIQTGIGRQILVKLTTNLMKIRPTGLWSGQTDKRIWRR
jgi:hypothetical protein